MAPVALGCQLVLMATQEPRNPLSGPITAAGLLRGQHLRHRGVGVWVSPPQGPGGPGPKGLGLAVGRFSQQHLSCWESCTSDPWVVATLSRRYNLQFRRWPLVFSGIRLTTVSDRTKCQALRQRSRSADTARWILLVDSTSVLPKNVHQPLGHCPVCPMASPALGPTHSYNGFPPGM